MFVQQSLVPTYADVNGNPCKVYFDVNPELTSISTSIAVPMGVGSVEANGSVIPLDSAPADAVSMRASADATAESASGASFEQGTPPGSIINPNFSASPPPQLLPHISANGGILYGMDGNPVVLKVGWCLD